jgi:hypothetical protein
LVKASSWRRAHSFGISSRAGNFGVGLLDQFFEQREFGIAKLSEVNSLMLNRAAIGACRLVSIALPQPLLSEPEPKVPPVQIVQLAL